MSKTPEEMQYVQDGCVYKRQSSGWTQCMQEVGPIWVGWVEQLGMTTTMPGKTAEACNENLGHFLFGVWTGLRIGRKRDMWSSPEELLREIGPDTATADHREG